MISRFLARGSDRQQARLRFGYLRRAWNFLERAQKSTRGMRDQKSIEIDPIFHIAFCRRRKTGRNLA